MDGKHDRAGSSAVGWPVAAPVFAVRTMDSETGLVSEVSTIEPTAAPVVVPQAAPGVEVNTMET